MAYGPTDSGKSHTMRVVATGSLKALVEKRAMLMKGGHSVTLSMSALEFKRPGTLDRDVVGGLLCHDLLHSGERLKPSSVSYPPVAPKAVEVQSEEGGVEVLKRIRRDRQTQNSKAKGTTGHEQSSRSHLITYFTLAVDGVESSVGLVDLAGSEAHSKDPDADKAIESQGRAIKNDLRAIRTCFEKLQTHAPTSDMFRGGSDLLTCIAPVFRTDVDEVRPGKVVLIGNVYGRPQQFRATRDTLDFTSVWHKVNAKVTATARCTVKISKYTARFQDSPTMSRLRGNVGQCVFKGAVTPGPGPRCQTVGHGVEGVDGNDKDHAPMEPFSLAAAAAVAPTAGPAMTEEDMEKVTQEMAKQLEALRTDMEADFESWVKERDKGRQEEREEWEQQLERERKEWEEALERERTERETAAANLQAVSDGRESEIAGLKAELQTVREKADSREVEWSKEREEAREVAKDARQAERERRKERMEDRERDRVAQAEIQRLLNERLATRETQLETQAEIQTLQATIFKQEILLQGQKEWERERETLVKAKKAAQAQTDASAASIEDLRTKYRDVEADRDSLKTERESLLVKTGNLTRSLEQITAARDAAESAVQSHQAAAKMWEEDRAATVQRHLEGVATLSASHERECRRIGARWHRQLVYMSCGPKAQEDEYYSRTASMTCEDMAGRLMRQHGQLSQQITTQASVLSESGTQAAETSFTETVADDARTAERESGDIVMGTREAVTLESVPEEVQSTDGAAPPISSVDEEVVPGIEGAGQPRSLLDEDTVDLTALAGVGAETEVQSETEGEEEEEEEETESEDSVGTLFAEAIGSLPSGGPAAHETIVSQFMVPLQARNRDLKTALRDMKKENTTLRAERREWVGLRRDNDALLEENGSLRDELDGLKHHNAALCVWRKEDGVEWKPGAKGRRVKRAGGVKGEPGSDTEGEGEGEASEDEDPPQSVVPSQAALQMSAPPRLAASQAKRKNRRLSQGLTAAMEQDMEDFPGRSGLGRSMLDEPSYDEGKPSEGLLYGESTKVAVARRASQGLRETSAPPTPGMSPVKKVPVPVSLGATTGTEGHGLGAVSPTPPVVQAVPPARVTEARQVGVKSSLKSSRAGETSGPTDPKAKRRESQREDPGGSERQKREERGTRKETKEKERREREEKRSSKGERRKGREESHEREKRLRSKGKKREATEERRSSHGKGGKTDTSIVERSANRDSAHPVSSHSRSEKGRREASSTSRSHAHSQKGAGGGRVHKKHKRRSLHCVPPDTDADAGNTGRGGSRRVSTGDWIRERQEKYNQLKKDV
ncbi:hypothetical protein KIPB_005464 [Kipferlia bialata]|uniref:Kinesin motor domain-containing protein n=1 Tax=Kipferlia bialata TaxID=797122 RepID=A0A9K3CVF0_9EUKA|nr:hypothetical protein KIPB_005464 [Kipferlia bialata]|eukprot:g5464.t1